MVRPVNEGTKIAFKILGVPPNISAKETEEQKKIKERTTFEDTMRSK
jgi:hypothetical protein